MTYDCMTPDELTLWREGSALVRNGGSRPCVDCPAWFMSQAAADGCCRLARPKPSKVGRPRVYPTDDAYLARRRQTWRESKRRLRGLAASGVRSDQHIIGL